jgi:F420 biosynthesis protein FbiB-like protein
MRLEEVIADRRSIRRFDGRPLPAGLVGELVALACTAPAPHHSRPWRFVAVELAEARDRLAQAMAAAWRRDLEADGLALGERERLLGRPHRQIMAAPALLVACLALDGARPWPDERRQHAERDMYVQSLGAALQNLMLAAHSRGLGSFIMGAPLFCPEAVADALGLPQDFEPLFVVSIGYPAAGLRPPPRPQLRLGDHLTRR